jgi:hypothetical protein
VIFRGIVARDARRIGFLITMCVFGAGRVPAQAPTPAPANQAPAPNQAPGPVPANTVQVSSGTLNILPLLGGNSVNNVRAPMPTDLGVEVRDLNDRPVEGATVTFQLPLMGASGSFEGGVRNKDVRTNVQGQAVTSFTPNTETGRMTIQVKAVAGGLSGMTTITERNSTTSVSATGAQGRKGGWIGHHKLLLIISAAVVGGVIAAVVVTRGGSSSSTSSGTTAIAITPGVPTIGGAH